MIEVTSLRTPTFMNSILLTRL